MTISILNSCGFNSENEISILKERCLLSINDGNELRMHDLLRDIGREIVNKESPKEPGKRSRLWCSEDIYNVLKKQKGTEVIEGIIIPYEGKLQEVTLKTETFERMDKLRLLDISDVRLTGTFEYIFEELRWLSWQRCDLQCLPSDFHPEKLVILDLQFSKINTLCHNILFLKQLKILNLSGCDFLMTTPDFRGIPNLEKLHLGSCTCLAKIHPSIGHLSRLASLDLTGCRILEELPEELGNIESLRELLANKSGIFKIPDSIGRLSRLVKLDLEYCRNLITLPTSLCNLRVFESLCLNNCDNLEELPEELGNIESLRVLRAGHTAITKLPDSIGRLSRLVNLDLNSCINLRTLPSSLCNLRVLESLYLNWCYNLEELPEELGNMESLRVLKASCTSLTKLPDSIGRLSRLVNLDLDSCENLRTLPSSFGNLRALESLRLDVCNNLEELPEELGNIESLKVLNAGHPLYGLHSRITKLPDSIGRLSRLVNLELDFCRNLRSLPSSLCNLRVLESLSLIECYKLEGLPEELGNIESLTVLRAGHTAITKLPDSIGRLSKLVNLDLISCRNLRTLPSSLCNLKVLESLCLTGCNNLEELPEELGNIESLRVLEACHTTITKLPDSIGRLTKLYELHLKYCRKLKNIPSSICKLPLRVLDLSSCEISDGNLLDNIGSLSSLEVLRLSSNIFSTLPSSLGQLSNLKQLELDYCESLRSVQKLPPNLAKLCAARCTSMERLPNLSNLKHLARLSLSDCSRLVEIQGLEKLNSFEVIHLDGCNNLAITFKETFFQEYSGFRKEIDIELRPTDCPDWFGHQEKGTTTCFDVPQNSENKYLGMILWVVSCDPTGTKAIVENKTNGNTWTDSRYRTGYSWVTFIPKTKIAVKFGDKIEASISSMGGKDLIMERFGVHLVYKTDSIEN